MRERQVKFTCDRCGAVEYVEDNTLTDPPRGWKPMSIGERQMHTCSECVQQVELFMTGGTLTKIGHFSQSGSGKRWTELNLDRQADRGPWFPVYALVRDGRAT